MPNYDEYMKVKPGMYKDENDITTSGGTVTIPSGYYSSQTTKSVATGALGTVSATKGTVSNNQVSVTPKISGGTAGYITATSKTGSAITVKASDLVSGSKAITANETVDVTNFKTVSVNVPPWLYGMKNSASGLIDLSSDSTSFEVPLNLDFTPNVFFICALDMPSATYREVAAFKMNTLSRWSGYSTDNYSMVWYRGNSSTSITSARVSSSSFGITSFDAEKASISRHASSGSYKWQLGSYRWFAFEIDMSDTNELNN